MRTWQYMRLLLNVAGGGRFLRRLGNGHPYSHGLGSCSWLAVWKFGASFGSKFSDRVENVCTAAVLGLTFATAPFVAVLTKEAATHLRRHPRPAPLLFIPLTTAFTLLRTVSTAAFTNVVAPHHVGTVLGINIGVGSAVRIVSAQVGSYMMKNYQSMGLEMLCATLHTHVRAGRAHHGGSDIGGTGGRPPAHRRSVEPCHTFSRDADVQIATKAKQLDVLTEQVTKKKAELHALKAVKKA
jgi:hypothetical protein